MIILRQLFILPLLVFNCMTPYRRILWRLFKIDLSRRDDRNAWYLVAEIFWASILGSVATFNAAYAIRLGANNFEVSLLNSIPALMAVLVSFPAGQFLQRKRRAAPWVMGSLFLNRVGYLFVAAAPLLHLFNLSSGMVAVSILVLLSIPGNFFNVGWTPLLAEIVPENRRAAVFTARNIINQATVCVVVFLCGQWLNAVVFPLNYQVLYGFGFVISLLSSYFLYKLEIPDGPEPPAAAAPMLRLPLAERFQHVHQSAVDFWNEMVRQPEFTRITMNTLMHGFGIWMAGPLYTLYYVRELNASDAWLGINGTLASLGTIAGYSLWRWLISKWGEPLVLKRTIVLLGLYPSLVGLSPSLTLILGLGILNGLAVPGVNLAHYNTLLRVIPADARPRYTAIYMTVLNVGAFICPMIALVFADWIGLGPMLVISGLLSVIGSTSFWWQPVTQDAPKEQPLAGL